MRRTRSALVVSALLTSLLYFGAPAARAGSVPDQAAAQGDENAHTHGPDPVDLDRRGRPGVAAATYAVDAHADWSPAHYDDGEYTTDQLDLNTYPTFHAVYVYPKDRASRFSTFAAMFQADARQASGLLTTLYGRALRFDERSAAEGSDITGSVLDITVLQSNYTYRQLSGGRQFSLVRDELKARGFTNPDKKYVAWLDAGSRYCGQAELYQDPRRGSANNNELRTTAIVYRPYDPDDLATGGFCRGRTLLHELGHNMGALQDDAPNAFDGAHCNDSGEDVMCYTSETSVDTGGPAFDWNNDDYWDGAANPALENGGKLRWWAVNLSRFVCPPGPDGPDDDAISDGPDCAAASEPGY